MKTPSVPDCSIIIPAYNADQHISECLASVFAQETKFSFEVLVVDDGSVDSTAEVISREFPDVRLFQKKNGGPGSARNAGADAALTDILVFIDADDRMLSGRLNHQVGYMLEHEDVKLCFGNKRREQDPDRDSNFESGWSCTDEYQVVEHAYSRLIVGGSRTANTATAVRRHAYLMAGGQPEDIFVNEDYSMYCQIAKRWPIAASCRHLTWYRQTHEGNLLSSAHTYEGPPKVLLDNLNESEELLSAEELEAALIRLRELVKMLVRYRWIYSGRRKAIETIECYQARLPKSFVFTWKLVTFIPSIFPRWIREVRHNGQPTHLQK